VSYRLPNAETLREYALSEFSELLAADGTGEQPDELDFYECRFNLAFYALRVDVVRRELAEVNGGADLRDESDSGEPQAYEDAVATLSTAFRNPETQQGTVYLQELLAAIDALPPDERKAVVLVHVMGYDEESEDPNKETAATLCNCTGRTIRNRLTRAAAKLSRFKEDA
jgi:DNA-directed RNA polymerase specialized sigma24 family protein